MKICLAGEGAMGVNHMKALSAIAGIEVVTLAGGIDADAARFAREWNIPHWSLDLASCLSQPGVQAVILATPSHLHAGQTELAIRMNKHVLVEIPMALNLADAQYMVQLEQSSGLVCMVCHTRRFNSPHREIRRRIQSRALTLHHIVAETYFFRRTNSNMFGQPRTWTDNLLWHHACHPVDLTSWLLEDADMEVWAQAGPDHLKLGIPMDMTLAMRSTKGCLVSLVLSFNNKGPFGTTYRYIGEEGTFKAVGDSLVDHEGHEIALKGNGFEMQDREFFDAIHQGRKPESSFTSCLPAMRMLNKAQLDIDLAR